MQRKQLLPRNGLGADTIHRILKPGRMLANDLHHLIQSYSKILCNRVSQ